MYSKLWLLLCSTVLFAASLPANCLAQGHQPLPPPPAAAPGSPSDMPGKSPIQAPAQAPVPAPLQTAACGPQVVTCTVMVPQMSYKTITVADVVCRPEVRQKNMTVCRMVPETTLVNRVETIVVPEQRKTTQTYTECRMTYETVQRQVTVMKPHFETRQATRTVCKPVMVQETRTVCKDLGQWTTQSYADCCGCTRTCQVWAAKPVTEQVSVAVCKPHFVEEPYTYQIVVCQPEQRTVNVQVAKPVYETKTREVTCLVPVAKQVERQVPQTTFRPVTESRVVSYTVMVPQRVERQVQVPVCTLVPKQVSYAVPPACGRCGW